MARVCRRGRCRPPMLGARCGFVMTSRRVAAALNRLSFGHARPTCCATASCCHSWTSRASPRRIRAPGSIPAPGWAHGTGKLRIKDESRRPAPSAAAAMAVSMARELGVRRVAAPTAVGPGRYAARAGIETWLLIGPWLMLRGRALRCPHLPRGRSISDGCVIVRDGVEPMDWFDMTRAQGAISHRGQEDAGVELADQLDRRLPTAAPDPTGGGTGLIGIGKAFGAGLARLHPASRGSTPASRTAARHRHGLGAGAALRRAGAGRAHHRERHPRAGGGG